MRTPRGFYRRGKYWWYAFRIGGIDYRRSTRCADIREAAKRGRELYAEAERGSLTVSAERPKRLFAAIDAYQASRVGKKRERTIELDSERLAMVKRHFGDVRLTAITADAIHRYQHSRQKAKIKARTINMDVGALMRVLKYCGQWERLKDQVQPLLEEEPEIGRALTAAERARLIETAASRPEWEHVYCAAVLASNTTLRSLEVRHLRRRDVDLLKQVVTVGRSKTRRGRRTIPLMPEALKAVARMIERADALGFTNPEHYLWHACQWERRDPTKPQKSFAAAWRSIRDAAGLPGLRFHDLRHTLITEMAEVGVPDETLKAMAGHVSQRMLEHYSHIRRQAKRDALAAVEERRLLDTKVDQESVPKPH